MAQFPITEAEIISLAEEIAAGLNANPADFPDPPVTAADLLVIVGLFLAKRDEQTQAMALAETITTQKGSLRDKLEDAMKRILRYAEMHTNFSDDMLKKLGWAGRRPPTPGVAPGQTMNLRASNQGEESIELQYEAPLEGGKPEFYKIERRQRPDGKWQIAGMGTSKQLKVTLGDQPRGVELEYRVIAGNAHGDGTPSNTVTAVL